MEGFKDDDNCSINKEHFPIKIYLCKYCGRDFINPQALGGHQNAHKMERREARLHKQAKVLSMMMASYGGGGAPLMPACCFVQPHGVTLLQDNNNTDDAEGSSSSFSSSNNHHLHHQQPPPLNDNYWPGSYRYRFDEGAHGGSYHDNPVPPPRITYHQQYHVYDGGADDRIGDGGGGGAPLQRGLQLELPDLNENY